jgi:hypothetical protein
MRLKTLMLAGASSLALTATAAAETVVGLAGDDLVMIDTATWTVTGTVAVTGTAGLLGIDVRPADGMLYGLTTDGKIVTLDTATGAATEVSTLSQTLAAGVTAVVDFNPVANRLRVIGSDGTNLRINVDDGAVTVDGALAFAATDAMMGMAPAVVAGAYTNSAVGPAPEATQLFDIDAMGNLLLQAPPNDGVLNTVGALGLDAFEAIAFDIVTNVGWLVIGDAAWTVNLETAETAPAGTITGLPGVLTDIAVLPAM